MNYRNFEKNIKDKLYNAEVDLDINQFILDLNTKQAKPRNGIFFLAGVIGFLFIAGSFYFLGMHEGQNNRALVHDFAVNTSLSESNVGPSAGENKVNVSNGSVIKVAHPETKLDLNENLTTVVAKKATYNNALNNAKTSESKTSKKDLHAGKLSPTYFENAASEVNPIINSKQAPAYLSVKEESMNDGKDNTSIAITASNSMAQSILLSLPTIAGILKKENIEIFHPYSKDVKCPTFTKKSPYRFSIIPEIGYFMPIKSILSNTIEPSEVFNLRSKNEQSLEGLQAALYLQMQKNTSPFYLRAGINYAQMTERMKLDYTFVQRDTSIGIISITKSPSGDTITTIYGEIVKETQRQGTKIGHHKFQLFDIPISVGFEKPFNGFNLGVEIGLSFNVSMSSTGKLLETSNTFKNISSNAPYKSNLGLNYFSSIFISKEIFENQSIYAALRARFIPNQFSESGASISEKYSFVGVHLGYKINF